MNAKWIEWNCRAEQEQAKLSAMINRDEPIGKIRKQADRVNKARQKRNAAQ